MREEDTCPTVPGAMNALSVAHDGKSAFIFQREKGIIVKQNLDSGEKVELSWKSKDFGTERFISYCIFHWKRLEDGLGPDRIGLLLFDRKINKFKLPLFIVTPENQLRKVRDFDISVPKVRAERMAYSAHKHAGKLELIFYERYDKNFPEESLNFVYVAVDLSVLELTRPKTGTLPPDGRWELPFVAEMKLHFLSLDRTGGKIASLPMNFLVEQGWVIQQTTPTNDGEFPSKRALWCHAWECGCPWFIVSKPNPSLTDMNHVQLWTINLTTKQWHKVSNGLDLRSDYTDLAIRATNSNAVFMYCDSKDANNAFFVSFDVTEYINSRQKYMEKEEELDKPITSKNYADIICPICLDTYSDPRTLFCGHSLCFACLARLREACGDVKCPNCRKVTKVPSEGLPTNYGLQQAIEMMIKVQRIHESGFRCLNCKHQGLLEDFWICLTCLKSIPLDLPESTEMTCASCTLKDHERHTVKKFPDFQEYCFSLRKLREECNEKIQKTADQVGEELKLLIQTEVVERLVTSAKQIVQSFVESKEDHEEKELEEQRNEVELTIKNVAEKLKNEARPLFVQMLEKAILEQEDPRPVSRQRSFYRKHHHGFQMPRLTAISEMSDAELHERLLRIN
ncbi:hypothetical protein FO519_009525 [Halicephalobus sp. NKZ332]|nr:hypothetical protein FO519_009525 [Halicephalobus sp. NKZ332]